MATKESTVIYVGQLPIEFEEFQWFSPRIGLQNVVPWKRKAYRKGLRSLGII